MKSIKMTTIKSLLLVFISFTLITSCVSSKKFKGLTAENEALKSRYAELEKQGTQYQLDIASLKERNEGLSRQLTDQSGRVTELKQNNSQVLQQLENMSVITKQ